jgi:hypothetical protein
MAVGDRHATKGASITKGLHPVISCCLISIMSPRNDVAAQVPQGRHCEEAL